MWNNLNKTNTLEAREEKYLKFCIESMKMQLTENLDAEIFTKLNLFSIFIDFFMHDEISTNYKNDFIDLMKTYMLKTGDKCAVKAEQTTEMVYFYEKLLFDKYGSIREPYFELLLILFNTIRFEQSFMETYFDKLNYALS